LQGYRRGVSSFAVEAVDCLSQAQPRPVKSALDFGAKLGWQTPLTASHPGRKALSALT